jgi:hypothetical protein
VKFDEFATGKWLRHTLPRFDDKALDPTLKYLGVGSNLLFPYFDGC